MLFVLHFLEIEQRNLAVFFCNQQNLHLAHRTLVNLNISVNYGFIAEVFRSS